MGVGLDVPDLDNRLARALRLVRLAWPEAHRDVVARTAMVVPVREPGLVSYSLAARPGISFINVHGKRTVDLADDLLHENSHHLMHDLQETVRLLAPGPATEEVQAFHSPWRGTLRPLHGILHGTFTFLFRAELFARILEAHARRPRVIAPLLGPGGLAFARRELGRELAMLQRGLADLGTAAAHRLITRDGRELAAALRAWHRRLRRRAAARPRRGLHGRGPR
jgi:HEXXH motif-containing protein